MVVDIQLGVKSYEQTLNLTKPMMFFEGVDQRIPFTMTAMHKGVVSLNKHNIKPLMRLNIQLGVKSYEQTLNLTKPMMFFEGVDQRIPFTMTAMHKGVVSLNKHNIKPLMRLRKMNQRLKGRFWTDHDVMKSNEMVKNIDQTLKPREQLRMLKKYVRGRPKTVNPRTFVRHM
nr:hypothetical protein [Tanacetum cinerariifolium]